MRCPMEIEMDITLYINNHYVIYIRNTIIHNSSRSNSGKQNFFSSKIKIFSIQDSDTFFILQKYLLQFNQIKPQSIVINCTYY